MITKLLAALALSPVIAISAPAVASADARVDDFLIDVRSAGLNVTSANETEVIALGLGVCVDLFNGFTINDEYNEMVNAGVNAGVAQDFLAAVISDLCPNSVRGSVQ